MPGFRNAASTVRRKTAVGSFFIFITDMKVSDICRDSGWECLHGREDVMGDDTYRILEQIKNTFCGEANTGVTHRVKEKFLSEWRHETALDCILARMDGLTGEQSFRLSAFPSNSLDCILKALMKNGKPESVALVRETHDAGEGVIPGALVLRYGDGTGNVREMAFPDEIREVPMDIKIPVKVDYMRNDMLTADLADFGTFSDVVDAMAGNSNLVVDYIVKTAGIPAVPVHLRDIGEFTLPTGERIERCRMAEAVAYDGDLFRNSVMAGAVLRGFIARSDDGIFPVVNHVTDIYQMGGYDGNEGFTEAMMFVMKGLVTGHNDMHGIYEMPSSMEIFNVVSTEGISGPYVLSEYSAGPDGIRETGAYTIDMDNYGIDYMDGMAGAVSGYGIGMTEPEI